MLEVKLDAESGALSYLTRYLNLPIQIPHILTDSRNVNT
jgi:hypothetical protein